MKLQKAAHTVYKTQYHIVWVTRYRRKILVKGVAAALRPCLQEVRKFHPDWFIEEIGIEVDHVHWHMMIPPNYAVVRVVEVLKSVTSRRLKERFPHFLRQVSWDGKGLWGRGFFVSTVGINEAIIHQYIRYQGEQDTGQAQLEF
jgi:putative transposase